MYLWPRHLLPPVGRALVCAAWFALAVPSPLVPGLCFWPGAAFRSSLEWVKRETVKTAGALSPPLRVEQEKPCLYVLIQFHVCDANPSTAKLSFLYICSDPRWQSAVTCFWECDSQFCCWMQAWISGPGSAEYVVIKKEGRERERETVLSAAGLTIAAALCAPALEEGREGLQPVKAISTNCVIDHSGGQ